MKVQDVRNTSIPALKEHDTVEDALGLIMEWRVRHLPVINEAEELVGIVSEEQLMDAPSADAEIAHLVRPNPVSTHPDAHVFDAAKIMVQHDLTTLPITAGDDLRYVGLVRRHDIFEEFAQMLATQESGAILALEVSPRDYALAKLVHVIEQNGAKVRAVASEPADGSEKIRVTIKLNVTDTTRIRHVLEHNDYRVVASFGEDKEEMHERAEAFMRYLEV
jgi:CBS domain-containing protein